MTALQKKHFDYDSLPDKTTRAFLKKKAESGRAILKRTAEGVWQMGELLTEVKSTLQHGEFGRWIEAELGLTDRTARNFMKVYDAFKTEKISDLNAAPSVLYMLSSPSVDDETREVATELIRSGELRSTSDAKALIAAAKPPVVEGEVVESGPGNLEPVHWPTSEVDDFADDVPDNAPEPVRLPPPAPPVEDDDEFEDPFADEEEPLPDAITGEPRSEAEEPTLEQKASRAEVIYDTLNSAPKEEDMPDEQWLDSLPIWRVLRTKAHKGIVLRSDLLSIRTLWKAKETFVHHARRAFNLDAQDNTPAGMVVLRLVEFPHPRDWQVHAPCHGNGCQKCAYSGYDTSGAGISPLRVETGEVALS